VPGKAAHIAATTIGARGKVNEPWGRANRIAIANSSPIFAGTLQMVAASKDNLQHPEARYNLGLRNGRFWRQADLYRKKRERPLGVEAV
jgi:hypothetical protein